MECVQQTKPLYRVKKRRVWELDFLRGFSVLAMCFDHFMFDCAHPWQFFSKYDMNSLYKFAAAYWDSGATYGFRFWAHYIFVFVFLFLVGTSCAFSRDNTRRGALCGFAAIAFTGISYACKAFGFMDKGIVFGILHCIAMCILLCAALDGLTNKSKPINLYLPLAIGGAILLAGILTRFWEIRYDSEFIDGHFTGYVMGTHAFGDDWFGIFPNVGAVLLGLYWGKAAYSNRVSLLPALDRVWNKPFTFVGRHAIIFYFLHQPVMVGLYMIAGLAMGFTL